MLKDITFGQYFPGNSPLHRIDPRAKIIITVMFIVAVFIAKSALAYAFLILSTLIIVLSGKIPVKTVLRGMKPLLFIVVFTAVINIFWTRGDTVLLEVWKIKITAEGLYFAAAMIVRIVTLLCGTSMILTYTTSPIALTDGIERLLSPLRVIKLPVHEFAMMMTIALRFIPTLIEETDKIMSAQKARGADYSSGSLISRAKSLIPVLIPLFVSSFRRAEELAVAMECRCYRGGDGRTRMTVLHLTAHDFISLGIFAVMIAAVILINRFLPYGAGSVLI